MSMGVRVVVFLHVGGDRVVALRDLIAIIDAQAFLISSEPEFVAKARREGKFFPDEEGEPNAYVVAEEGIYATVVTAQTLRRRTEQLAAFLRQEGNLVEG